MSYLYKTYLYKDESKVSPVPENNTEDLADFEDNHKADAMEITELVLAETVFSTDKSYSEFDALITGGILWSDVKYIEDEIFYELSLLSDTPL